MEERAIEKERERDATLTISDSILCVSLTLKN